MRFFSFTFILYIFYSGISGEYQVLQEVGTVPYFKEVKISKVLYHIDKPKIDFDLWSTTLETLNNFQEKLTSENSRIKTILIKLVKRIKKFNIYTSLLPIPLPTFKIPNICKIEVFFNQKNTQINAVTKVTNMMSKLPKSTSLDETKSENINYFVLNSILVFINTLHKDYKMDEKLYMEIIMGNWGRQNKLNAIEALTNSSCFNFDPKNIFDNILVSCSIDPTISDVTSCVYDLTSYENRIEIKKFLITPINDLSLRQNFVYLLGTVLTFLNCKTINSPICIQDTLSQKCTEELQKNNVENILFHCPWKNIRNLTPFISLTDSIIINNKDTDNVQLNKLREFSPILSKFKNLKWKTAFGSIDYFLQSQDISFSTLPLTIAELDFLMELNPLILLWGLTAIPAVLIFTIACLFFKRRSKNKKKLKRANRSIMLLKTEKPILNKIRYKPCATCK